MADTLEARLASIERTERRIESILRARTALPDPLLQQRLSQEVNLGCQSAQRFGIVDSVEEFLVPPNVMIHVIQ